MCQIFAVTHLSKFQLVLRITSKSNRVTDVSIQGAVCSDNASKVAELRHCFYWNLEAASEVIYLGSIITADNTLNAEVSHRVASAVLPYMPVIQA